MREVRMKGFTEPITVNEAHRRFRKELEITPLPTELIPIREGLGRVLGEDVEATFNIPHFDRSAVDGYAVRARDTFGASPTNPLLLQLKGAVEIGEKPTLELAPTETLRVATGAPTPRGADAVVMLEYAEELKSGMVEIYKGATPGENISKKGEDVNGGEMVLRRGTRLQPQDIGILAALGRREIRAVRKPRVGVLSTGNELVEPMSHPPLGETIDSNRYTMWALVEEAGGTPFDLGICPDDVGKLAARLGEGVERGDIVLVSGGTSVGGRDLVPDAVNSLGKPGVVVHGVAIKPGRPVGLAAVRGKPIILLPGFPVAAVVAFYTFVRPLIASMLGASSPSFGNPRVSGVLSRRIPSTPGVREYVRVGLRRGGGGLLVDPLRATGSGVLSSMVKAQGIVIIPEEREGIEEGEVVEVHLLRPLEV